MASAQIGQHFAVRTIIGIQLPFPRTDIDPSVGFGREVIDQRTVGDLIGDKQSMESSLLKGRNDTLLFVYIVKIERRNGAEQHRNAFMGGITLCQHIAERHQPLTQTLLESRCGLPIVSEQAP